MKVALLYAKSFEIRQRAAQMRPRIGRRGRREEEVVLLVVVDGDDPLGGQRPLRPDSWSLLILGNGREERPSA